MTEYSIEIKDRLIGMSFISYNQNEFMISELPKNSIVDNLGLSIGDRLVSINNINVSKMTISAQYAFKDIQYIFHDQTLPFIATFKRKVNMIINNNHECAENDEITENDELSENDEIDAHSVSSYNYQQNCPCPPYNAYLPTYALNKSDKSDIEIIEQHIFQNKSKKDAIYFDKVSVNSTNQKICLLSTNGLSQGKHEWEIEILKCDIYSQEIGIIGTKKINEIKIKEKGIVATKKYLARAIYGSELRENSVYYGSYNNDGRERCFKDLSKKYQIGWCSGDIIKVSLDLKQWKIKFYINGVKVRKVMSVQQGNTYYAVLSFTGNCQYNLC